MADKPIPVPKVDEIALRRARLHGVITREEIESIEGLSTRRLEGAYRQRLKLEGELAEKRRRYKYYKDLFDSPQAQAKLLNGILAAADTTLAEIDKLKDHPTMTECLAEDEVTTFDNVTEVLAWLNEQLNRTALTTEQIVYLSEDIPTSYGSLRIRDVILCIRNALRGIYGPIYDSIDTATVHAWMQRYEAEIKEGRANHRANRHVSTKDTNQITASKARQALKAGTKTKRK